MKLYTITSKNSFDDQDNILVLSPSAEDHSVNHDLEWSNIESYNKYGTFDFIIVLTEPEKQIIEDFIADKETTEKYVKGNNAAKWKEVFKASEYRKEIQIKAVA